MTRRDVGIRFTYALGGAVHCAVAGPVDAASAKNTVLVHAACFDGSGWEPVCEIPFKDGYHVSVDQEPLTSLLETSRQPDASSPSSLVRASLWPTVPAARSRRGRNRPARRGVICLRRGRLQ